MIVTAQNHSGCPQFWEHVVTYSSVLDALTHDHPPTPHPLFLIERMLVANDADTHRGLFNKKSGLSGPLASAPALSDANSLRSWAVPTH